MKLKELPTDHTKLKVPGRWVTAIIGALLGLCLWETISSVKQGDVIWAIIFAVTSMIYLAGFWSILTLRYWRRHGYPEWAKPRA